MTLEDFVHQQFTPGQSVHAVDHDHMRDAEKARRRLSMSMIERALWAVAVFLAVALWDAAKR